MSDVEFDFHEFENFAARFQQMTDGLDGFCTQMADQLAAELLRKCIKRTPVDTGKLKQNWRASAVRKEGDAYVVEVSNETLYASYVEYGHRQQPGRYVPAIGKRLKASWVPGRFMMTLSAAEVERGLESKIERALTKYMEQMLND
ncbi:HK97 gp10 family phage protein [Caproicibacterium sp. XB1]|uniref:HK97 gp10 family phage protein n=1 Tax=Caproicibacterium sp. XB1 TaxID=3396405 RepID=UPI0039B6F246